MTLHPLLAVDVLRLLGDRPVVGLSSTAAELVCRRIGLFGYIVTKDGDSIGFAIARSLPRSVVVTKVIGQSQACRLLLMRLTAQAGERDINVWCPVDCFRLGRLLRSLGFEPHEQLADEPACLYRLSQAECPRAV